MTFIFPVLILGLSLGMQVFGEQMIEEVEAEARESSQNAAATSFGFVDNAGIIEDLPNWVPENLFIQYTDAQTGEDALRKGELIQLYIVPEDYLEDGKYFLIDRNYNPIRSVSSAELFERILTDNILAIDPINQVLMDPTASLTYHAMMPEEEIDEESRLDYIVPFATLFIFFFAITSSSGYLLQSVTKEKENQTAEILISSIKPLDLMIGKVIGLGTIALAQLLIWFGGGLLSLQNREKLFNITEDFSIPDGFLVWAILYFLFGYFLYASIMAVVGVLAPNSREAGQYTFVVILPLIIPMWLNAAIANKPDSTLSVILSLIPFTSPPTMIMRLSATNVPFWQPAVGLVFLLLTSIFIIYIAASFFRAEYLLSTVSLSWSRIIREIKKLPDNI